MRLDVWEISGSGFHFGRHGLGQEESTERFASDSLFAALTARSAVRGGQPAVDAWIANIRKDPPAFVLSSAFPRAGGVRFYPLPLRVTRAADEAARQHPKKIKKLKYVSESVFLRLLQGEPIDRLYQEGKRLQGEQVLIDAKEVVLLPAGLREDDQMIWKVEKRPRVTLGRKQASSTLYHTGRTVFAANCGLWFAVRWLAPDEELATTLAGLLEDLADAGLGGERSAGFGQAGIRRVDQPIELPEAAGSAWVSLSRYHPRPQDSPALLHPQAAYAIESSGGWVQSPGKAAERRRSLTMLLEGSVFGALDRQPPGQLVDVQPDYDGKQPLGHPVWRNGFALAVAYPAAFSGGR